jgi:membrane-bound lytic murein transglycosylase D
MAPDSSPWGLHLGEAQPSLQQRLLKATLPVCLFLTLSTSLVEARTRIEPAKDSWSAISPGFLAHERTPERVSLALTSLPSPQEYLNSSPIGQRSERIQIHIPNHSVIEKHIRFYKGQGRTTFIDALERARRYVPIMSEILESYGVPAEMLAVVLVESRFKKQASHKGAVGYWQLLASTARSMGLRVDRWVDERYDAIKSTHAAARYLRSSYNQFNSWPLALAAYNAGDGAVKSAVRRCGTSDFWDLSGRGALPSGTSSYVPKVLAAAQILRELETHGFERPKHFSYYDFESVRIGTPLKLEQVAGWINIPISHMQDLNPSLRLDRIPPDGEFALNLPSGARDKFDLAYANHLRK